MCNCRKFALLFWAELQHCVYDRQQCLLLTASMQENKLQQHIFQILQVCNWFLSLLIPLQTTHLTLQELQIKKIFSQSSSWKDTEHDSWMLYMLYFASTLMLPLKCCLKMLHTSDHNNNVLLTLICSIRIALVASLSCNRLFMCSMLRVAVFSLLVSSSFVGSTCQTKGSAYMHARRHTHTQYPVIRNSYSV